MLSAVRAPTIVVTGGAGYIGSHVALCMAQKGYNVIAIDSFRHQQRLPALFQVQEKVSAAPFFEPAYNQTQGSIVVVRADFADKALLEQIFNHHAVQAVIHCAGLIEVGESVKNPRAFYDNNVVKTIQLLETMLDYGVKKCIFSSSCAVYGQPKHELLVETDLRIPISPYGKNKLAVELVLEDFAQAYDLKSVCLRYFNAAGALPEYGLGEQHLPETHLIPLLLRAAHENKPFQIFGNDYPTKDGSCVRDFLHVWDLAQAHSKALDHLNNGHPSDCFNLGTGNGISILEMIRAVEKNCAVSINCTIADRRAGDPPLLVADPSKAHNILGWEARCSDLEFIIGSAHSFYTMMRTRIHGKGQARAVHT